MTSNPAMAAALNVLTEALDDPHTDIAHDLQLLAAYGAAAVTSYCGLSVVVPHSDPPLNFTALTDGATADDIRTSVQLELPACSEPRKSSAVAIILYARSPGAFVDLAADLTWFTGRPATSFVLDEHLTDAAGPRLDGQLHAVSAINQAIGVLIGRGYTPGEADGELDASAARSQTDRYVAARGILAEIPTDDHDGDLDVADTEQ